MAGVLTLFEGPPGSGKSQSVQQAIADGELDVVADFTSLWAAVRQVQRGPDGRYPIRRDDDPALTMGYLTALQTAAVSIGLRRGMRVAVTSGTSGTAPKWAERASVQGATFAVRTYDPGEAVVRERLIDAETGELAPECETAIRRWYK